jgi:hypothetical protein
VKRVHQHERVYFFRVRSSFQQEKNLILSGEILSSGKSSFQQEKMFISSVEEGDPLGRRQSEFQQEKEFISAVEINHFSGEKNVFL